MRARPVKLFLLLNVARPPALSEVGFYDTVGEANRVAVAGSYAYVADTRGGLAILRFTSYQCYLPLALRDWP